MSPEWAALAGAAVVLTSLATGAALVWWGASARITALEAALRNAIAALRQAEENAKNAQPERTLDVLRRAVESDGWRLLLPDHDNPPHSAGGEA